MSKIIRIDTLRSGDKRSCSTNGSGFKIVIWFLGCDIHCKGCHNIQYWDFNNPNFENFSDKHIQFIISEMKNNINVYSGLSVLGGEPFSVKNIDDVVKLCEEFKKTFANKDIWIWSGHKLEWLKEQNGEYGEKINNLLNLCDFLIDGPFDINQRNISLKFRGSTNQIIWEKKNNEWVRSELNE